MLPASLQALLVIVFGIVPGFVGIRGYSRRRYRTVPDRDLYALAGAVVISSIWLGAVWLVLLWWGDPLSDWGLVPVQPAVLGRHQAEVAWLGLIVICLPFPLGSAAAIAMNLLEELSRWAPVWKLLRKTGFFRPPTAWDRSWRKFTREQGGGEILVQMEDGLLVKGGYGKRSQADLSPNSPQLFLESGYGYRLDDDGMPGEVEGLGDSGVYLPGDRIAAIYFLPQTGIESPAGEGTADPTAKQKTNDELP